MYYNFVARFSMPYIILNVLCKLGLNLDYKLLLIIKIKALDKVMECMSFLIFNNPKVYAKQHITSFSDYQ